MALYSTFDMQDRGNPKSE